MDKKQSVPTMVTIFWGDLERTVPIWVAMRAHFLRPEVVVRGPEVLSDAEIMARGVEAGEIVCPDLTWEELSGELSRVVGRGDEAFGPSGDSRSELPSVLLALIKRLRLKPLERGWDLWDEVYPIPRPNWLSWTQAALRAGVGGPSANGGPAAPRLGGLEQEWDTLNPHPLPPRALELVPAALRQAVIGLTSLAIAESATGEVNEEALGRQLGALRRALDDCGTPPRRLDALGRRRRWPFPPRKVLSDLAALLGEGRVQVEVSRVALELSERAIG